MPELSEAVKTAQAPPYVGELGRDLEFLLDVAFELRSVPEDEMERWLKGENCIVRPDNPHKKEVQYFGQPVQSIVKEYEVGSLSGEKYRLVVHPKKLNGVVSNNVRVKFTKTYAVGENPEPGILIRSDDAKKDLLKKNVLYLLPLAARLPLREIDYEAVKSFLIKYNGFGPIIVRPEVTQLRDSYVQKRPVAKYAPLLLENERGEIVKPARRPATEPVWMDVYLTVHDITKSCQVYDPGRPNHGAMRLDHTAVRLELEVVIPEKKVA